MKRLMPIFIVILLSGCGILTAYAPNMLSMIVVAVMGVVVLLGIIYGLIPVLTFTQGLLTARRVYREPRKQRKSRSGSPLYRWTVFQTEENGPVVSGIQGQGKAAAPEWTDRQ